MNRVGDTLYASEWAQGVLTISLARFVAANLLKNLTNRLEFDNQIFEKMHSVVVQRNKNGAAEMGEIMAAKPEKSAVRTPAKTLSAKNKMFIPVYLAGNFSLTIGALQKAYAKQNIKGIVVVF
jgi:hypothetical protein